MRLNKYLSDNTELSRRKADIAIDNGRVAVDGDVAKLGATVEAGSSVTIDGKAVQVSSQAKITVLLNKPVGFVCSKDGQGSKTVYEILPSKYEGLNIAGRLDKDSSGLVILTNDGILHNELTHPSKNKQKIYKVSIDKPMWPEDQKKLLQGVDIGDERPSKFKKLRKITDKTYSITLEEGRNRQIRRTFEALGYEIKSLNRTAFGPYSLESLKAKKFIEIV